MDVQDELLTHVEGRALVITLNCPDKGNAATDAMAGALARALDSAHEQADFVLLHGAGEDFCMGRRAGGGGGPPAGPLEALDARTRFDVVFDCYGAFRRAQVPVVGIVRGRAHGFGAALAALCDITIASDDARFAVPEMRHRILPTMVASAFAGRVSPKGLLYMLYSTEEIDAERALAFGLVSEIASANALDATVATLVERLLASPREALIGLKDFARVSASMDHEAMVAYARNLHATVNTSSSLRR